MATITITLVKSPIGRLPEQRKTVRALGLGKLGSSVVKEDTPSLRGMANSIGHLVRVEEGGKAEVKRASKTSVKVSANESASKEGKPGMSSTVAEIKAYLDATGITYSSADKKADLLSLVK